ncbi:MAG: hypothetical protein U0172_07555 [Nitrospiraceae bacterium]
MRDPRRTIRLLDELESLGFTDEAFAEIHHFERGTTIERHRKYCLETGAFQESKANERVQQRLEIVFRAYWGGGFRECSSALWVLLAKAAAIEVPKDGDA